MKIFKIFNFALMKKLGGYFLSPNFFAMGPLWRQNSPKIRKQHMENRVPNERVEQNL